ncbi:hypothetical protein L9F63_001003, partial [Diploptera punctata]
KRKKRQIILKYVLCYLGSCKCISSQVSLLWDAVQITSNLPKDTLSKEKS